MTIFSKNLGVAMVPLPPLATPMHSLFCCHIQKHIG